MKRGIIIGLGHIALSGHAPAWANCADVVIVGGVDTDAQRHAQLQNIFPRSVCATTLDLLLQKIDPKQIDFVDICTPPFAHFELAQIALKNNWHVLCEKPLVLHKNELAILEDAARARNLALVTVHNWRFAPICQKISALIAQNTVGSIARVEWQVLRTQPSITTEANNWRLDPQKAGGGILMDHGWHAIYLVLGWMQQAAQKVDITLENRKYTDLPIEDTATLKLHFKDQASATIFLTWASDKRANLGCIAGSKGRIEMLDDRLEIFDVAGIKQQTILMQEALSAGSHHPEWFPPIVQEFLTAMTNPEQRHTNLNLAAQCLNILRA